MICPFDQLPCTGDHSKRCETECREALRREAESLRRPTLRERRT